MNLLDLALGFDQQLAETSPLSGKVVLIEDCVETSGSFVIHQLMKRVLSSQSSDALIFLAFARPFSHYDRILRKLVIKKIQSFFICLCGFLHQFGFLVFYHCLGMQFSYSKVKQSIGFLRYAHDQLLR